MVDPSSISFVVEGEVVVNCGGSCAPLANHPLYLPHPFRSCRFIKFNITAFTHYCNFTLGHLLVITSKRNIFGSIV